MGLSNAQVDASRRAFGANEFPSAPRPSLFALLFEAIKDPMVLILLVGVLRAGCPPASDGSELLHG